MNDEPSAADATLRASEALVDNDTSSASPEEPEDVDELVGGPSFFAEEAAYMKLQSRLAETLPPPTPASRSVKLRTASEDPTGAAAIVEELAEILSRYQESPHLLHPFLERLVEPLMTLLLEYLPPASESHANEQRCLLVSGAAAFPVKGVGVSEGVSERGSPMTGLGQNFDAYDADAPKTAIHHVCRALYAVVKTGGEKCGTSHFSNDVRHCEDAFYALRWWHADPAKRGEWEVRYCLLLWLSNLVLVPFALSVIDTNAATVADEASSLSDAILLTAVGFLSDTSKCREGAGLLVARLLTRPDSQRHRDMFFAYAQEVLSQVPPAARQLTVLSEALVRGQPESETSKRFLFPGVLLAMAKTLKLGLRQELKAYASGLIPCVGDLYRGRSRDCVLCKTAVKVTQRLVLSVLRKQQASWKYQRHVASLDTNLRGSAAAADRSGATVAEPASPGVDTDLTLSHGDFVAVEEGTGLLLEALGHRDTVVRWSAAKGIGRVCERLPADMLADVLAAVNDLFCNEYSDTQWHGGLLAVAELCRRGLVNAEGLTHVVEVIRKGLSFDLSKGTYSVGAHVRDAACYTCWSMARATDAVDLAPHVHQLSTGLVTTALFDREVNVRRAAAAAFQECVGRLGNFPDGIALVTTMDFFALASLTNAYTRVAPRVARYDAHRPAMLEEVVGRKLLHWDRAVCQHAAVALGHIAVLETSEVVNEVFDELVRRVTDPAAAARYGAIWGLAELVRAMPQRLWSEKQRGDLVEVVVRLDAARLFRSRGGEYVRQACCELLSACAARVLPLPEFVVITKLSGEKGKARTLARVQEFLEDSWRNILEWLQRVASDAFARVAAVYYTPYNPAFHGKVVAKMLENCRGGSRSPLERRGFLAAVGGLPSQLLTASQTSEEEPAVPFVVPLFDVLQAAAVVQPGDDPQLADAESRRNAVQSLGRILCAVPAAHPAMSRVRYVSIVETLLAALHDYALDKRGDVGSFSRIASLQALPSVVAYGLAPSWCDAQLTVRVLQSLVQVSMEKLDRVRASAGVALEQILLADGTDGKPDVVQALWPSVLAPTAVGGEVRQLQSLVRDCQGTHWDSPQSVITALAGPLLCNCPEVFAASVMEGIVLSAGDLTAHVQRPAMASLLVAFGNRDGATAVHQRLRLSHLVVAVGMKFAHEERVLVPLSRCLDSLLNECVLATETHAVIVSSILRSELKHFATSIVVLLPLVTLLANLCHSPCSVARHDAWGLALTMIASRYPKVRSKMATDLYAALLVFTAAPDVAGSVPSQGCAEAMEHLLAVQWDANDATRIRTARNQLYGMLGITPPLKAAGDDKASALEMKSVTAASTSKVASSYMHLVQEMGY